MNLTNLSTAKETKEQVVSFLEELGCCPRCVLRFTGNKHKPRLFVESLAGIRQAIDDLVDRKQAEEPDAKKRSGNVCIACLGMLQIDLELTDINKIPDLIKNHGYEFTEFSVGVSMPTTVVLRDAQVLSRLSSKFDLPVEQEALITVKDVWRLLLTEFLSRQFSQAKEIDSAPFLISIWTSHSDVSSECARLFDRNPSLLKTGTCKKKPRSRNNGKDSIAGQYNHAALQRAKETLGLKYFSSLPLDIPTSSFTITDITFSHEPIFLAGRYNKYSRNISQTPWLIEGEKKDIPSVQDIIFESVLKAIPAEGAKFSASGREDVDVRMLGDGRPFVVELVNPKNRLLPRELIERIEDEINARNEQVAVRDLQEAAKKEVQLHIKEGEQEKTKHYSAACCASRPLTSEDVQRVNQKGLTIAQDTPIRVLHRRTLMTRDRTIQSLEIEIDKTDARLFTANLITDAGTYIKEFVHGDFGRTNPSVATLLGDCRADIIDLDVMGVYTDWPKPINREKAAASVDSSYL